MDNLSTLSHGAKAVLLVFAAAWVAGMVAVMIWAWHNVLPKLKSLPYDWILPPVGLVVGLVVAGYGVAEVVYAPPGGFCSEGLSDEKIKQLATDRDATPDKVKELLVYARDRDQANRDVRAGLPTKVYDGSYRLGLPTLFGGVGLGVIGFVMWCRRLNK